MYKAIRKDGVCEIGIERTVTVYNNLNGISADWYSIVVDAECYCISPRGAVGMNRI